MYFLSTFISIAVLLVLLIPGYMLRKLKLVSNAAAKDLSGLLLYIGLPALVFYCMMGVDIRHVSWQEIVLCLLITVIVHLIGYIAIKLILIRCPKSGAKSAASFSAIFSNCGFLGIPLSEIAVKYCEVFAGTMDESLSRMRLYVTLFNVVFNLLNWTLGVALYGAAEKKSVMIRKAILNPCTLAFIAALPFTLTGLSLLQPINVGGMEIGQIADLITYLYNICVPVSMCILGIRLADMKIKRMFVSGYMYASLGVKMVIVPAIICVGCLVLHRLFGMSGELALGMVVMAVTPTATTALAFAERFNGDTAVAGECIMSSTVVALVIVPAFLMLTASFL